MSDTETLRQSLRAWARGEVESGPGPNGAAFTERACRAVLDQAGVPYTPEQLGRAFVAFRRNAFYGGNFRQDAVRILTAMEAAA